jgi:hypothetical protein
MNMKELRQLADKDSVHQDFSNTPISSIVKVRFRANGLRFECQYDDENSGLYAISCNDADIQKLLQILADKGDES